MTDDVLERQVKSALAARAQVVTPGERDFADVEARAVRRRRSRSRRVRVIAVASMVVVAVAMAAVAGLGPDESRVTVGPVDDLPATTTTVTAPTGLVGDRWAVLSGTEPARSDIAVETVRGIQPEVPGRQDIEVTPYVYVGDRSVDPTLLYGLGGQRWTTTITWTDLPAGGSANVTMISGSDFDPARLTEISNPLLDGGIPNPSLDGPRPEPLLAGSRPVTMPVEHLGLFDWMILPVRCTTDEVCTKVGFGGDGQRVIIVELTGAPDLDLRAALGEVTLRSGDELAQAPGTYAPAAPGATVEPYLPPAAWSVAPFFTVFLAVTQDDTAWPDEVPGDYCSAFRQWKDIQVATLGAFGTPGWIRWAEALDAMAPPEVGDAWSVIVAEQAAGHDTSATEPGLSALGTVVTDGDARCSP